VKRAAPIATLVVAALLGSAGSATAKTVSAKRWAASFCKALVSFKGDLLEVGQAIDDETVDATADLAAGDLAGITDLINGIAGHLERASDVATDASRAFRRLPRPAIDGGAVIKRTIARVLGGAADGMALRYAANASHLREVPGTATDPADAINQLDAVAADWSSIIDDFDQQMSEAFENVDTDVDRAGKLGRALTRSKACAPIFG